MNDAIKPLRTVMGWQGAMTGAMAILCGWQLGVHGAVSAMLGGAVAMTGGLVFALMASSRKVSAPTAEMAWDGLTTILKAEGAKIAVIVILLWLVLLAYKDVVMLGFIGTFILAVIIFSMAVFIRNPVSLEADKNNVH